MTNYTVSTDRKYHKTPTKRTVREMKKLETFKCSGRDANSFDRKYYRWTVSAESKEEAIASFIYNEWYKEYHDVNLPSTILISINGKRITNEEVYNACTYLEKWHKEGNLIWLCCENRVKTTEN